MKDDYWVIYMLEFSGPISSGGLFGRDDLEIKILKIVEGTFEDAERHAKGYMTANTLGRTIGWQKAEDGLVKNANIIG